MAIGQITSKQMTNAVYILLCSNGRYYAGSSNDVRRRLGEHQSGYVNATRHLRPVELLFSQSFSTLPEARKIEYTIKQKKSRVIIEKIITDGYIKIRGH